MTNDMMNTCTTAVALTRHQPTSDEKLLGLWLHGRSRHTYRAYSKDAKDFLTFVKLPLRQIALGDVQAYADHLNARGLRDGTRHRKLAAVKSFFSFALRIGYLPFDVSRPVHLPALRDGLNNRILDEGEVHRMIVLEPHPRNRVLLHLLYVTGIRVSEATGLIWGDCQHRGGEGQITVFGKGRKTRAILLPSSAWSALLTIRGDADSSHPVFRSRKGGSLGQSQIWHIVRGAARRAGIQKQVCPHFMRHSHASHALDRGAPIHLVQSTLGHSSVATTGKYLHARPTDSSANYLSL